jgi:hypothetical protein
MCERLHTNKIFNFVKPQIKMKFFLILYHSLHSMNCNAFFHLDLDKFESHLLPKFVKL